MDWVRNCDPLYQRLRYHRTDDNGYGGTDYVSAFDGFNAGNEWTGNTVPELSDEPALPPAGNLGNGGC